MLAVAPPAMAAEMIGFTTVKNTDVASFGIGYLRGNGTGTLNVSGVTGSATRAYLYWHGPTNSTNAAANANVSFGGTSITGTNVGFSADNFWSFANSQAYRSDVTSLLTGNGSYALSNFTKSDAEINGASLIVFYDDGDLTNNRDVVLFDGNDSNFNNVYDADNWNAVLNNINYASGSATLTLHVSDGQDFSSIDDGNLSVNGTIIGSGGLFQGDGVQFGNGNTPGNGALWDIETFNIAPSLSPGNNSLSLSLPGQTDALSLVVAQFNLPVGAAPDVGAVPEPATWAMMLGGFGMIGGAMRRRQKVTTRVRFA